MCKRLYLSSTVCSDHVITRLFNVFNERTGSVKVA